MFMLTGPSSYVTIEQILVTIALKAKQHYAEPEEVYEKVEATHTVEQWLASTIHPENEVQKGVIE